eukprot:3914424-Amphidinium_carterae.1
MERAVRAFSAGPLFVRRSFGVWLRHQQSTSREHSSNPNVVLLCISSLSHGVIVAGSVSSY